MAMRGGSLRECSINKRVFQCPADAQPKMALGGYSNEVTPCGGGAAIVVQTAIVSSIESLVVGIDNDNDDLKFLQDIADAGEFVPCTISYADGNTFDGELLITEPPSYDAGKATCELKLQGRNKINRQ